MKRKGQRRMMFSIQILMNSKAHVGPLSWVKKSTGLNIQMTTVTGMVGLMPSYQMLRDLWGYTVSFIEDAVTIMIREMP